jgi:hypothetical protein
MLPPRISKKAGKSSWKSSGKENPANELKAKIWILSFPDRKALKNSDSFQALPDLSQDKGYENG